MTRRYIFLLGAPRSGTTWLQIMLSNHPAVSTCQETHLFSGYLSGLERSWRKHAGDQRGVGLQAALSRARFIELQRDFALSVLDSIGETPVILEKTPAHITVLDQLQEVLPEARFIHIIRDPRAVAASLAAAGRDWGHSWASTSALHNARRWRANVSEGLALRRKAPGRCYELRYEDLLADTAGHLAELFAWMDLENGGALAREVAEESDINRLQKGDSQAAWDLSKEPKGFFRKGRADSWKEELSRSDIAAVEAIAGPLMEELGYDRVTPGMSWRQSFGIRAREGLARRLSSLAMRLQ